MTAPGGFSFSNLVMGREERLLEEGERERIAPADAAGAKVRATWVARDRTDIFNEEPLVQGEPRRLFFATAEKKDRNLPPDKPSPNAPRWSVRAARAQLYLPCCFCYNFCCCCWDVACCGLDAPFKWCGPLCGSKFWCNGCCLPCYIDARRDVWLRWMHFLCFCIHVAWLIITIEGAWGHDMNVQIVRVKPEFVMPGEYGFAVAASPGIPHIRYDLLVASFFGLSAFMHSMWVFLGGTKWAKRALWDNLDNCLCWWRWLEYSFSASIMFVGIAIITAIRDQNTLSAIAFLSFTTMWLGFVTEMLSRPTDDREKWIGDPDPVAAGVSWSEWQTNYFAPKFKSYTWRMLPHVLGFFPYITAWVLIVNAFVEQINDLPEDLRDRIPDFVIPAVAGSIAIFSCFTFVQIRYQWLPPKYYWRTELWYCALSATSKVYLGALLYSNVLLRSRFDDADWVARWTPPSAPPPA